MPDIVRIRAGLATPIERVKVGYVVPGSGAGGYDDTALVARVAALEGASVNYTWAEIADKPATFAPAPHGHTIEEVDGLDAALDGKMPTTTFKTVNGESITGAGDIAIPAGADAEIVSFSTDAEAEAYSAANPGAAVFSREGA